MTSDPRPPGRDAPLEPDPMLGRSLAARYDIAALVARGGMARVYRARDDRLDRDVAVKVLAPPYADDPAFIDRFLAEARAAASISHPSLVHVYDSGSDGAAHYIVMELLDRHRTLRELLGQRGRLAVDEVARIGSELLAGLRAVHERGLVHCDVKAANVMLGPGPAKLIDFGIARSPDEAAKGSTSIGTLSSMSPEQLRGEALTPASDLFSLGTVLYECLTGRVPFPGSTPDEVRERQAEGLPPAPSSLAADIPERLDGLVLQSLRPDPDARFRSAEAMAAALAVAVPSTPSSPVRPIGSDDETRVVAVDRETGERGYVPPVVAASGLRPPPERRDPAKASERRAAAPVGRPPRRRSTGGLLGAVVLLGAAALVVVFVVVPLLRLPGTADGPDDGSGAPTPIASPNASEAIARDVIPETIGLATADAIELASRAGLNWRLECAQDPQQPEGIINQEPPAGTQVAPGSRFTMFSARIRDCRGGEDD